MEKITERGRSPLSYLYPLPFISFEGKGVRGIGFQISDTIVALATRTE
jgi:hypothetical protein